MGKKRFGRRLVSVAGAIGLSIVGLVGFVPQQAQAATTTISAAKSYFSAGGNGYNPSTNVPVQADDGKAQISIFIDASDASGKSVDTTVAGNLSQLKLTSTGSAKCTALTGNTHGYSTATCTDTKAETVTLTATANGTMIGTAQKAQFATPGVPVAFAYSGYSTDAISTADPVGAVIEVGFKDANGLFVTATTAQAQQLLKLSVTGSVKCTAPTVLQGDPTAVATCADTKAETVTVTPIVNGQKASDFTLRFATPGPTDLSRSSFSVSNNSVWADGTDFAYGYADLKDTNGLPPTDASSLSVKLSGSAVATGGGGSRSFNFSDSKAETVAVTATVGGKTLPVRSSMIQFFAPPSVTVNGVSVKLDGANGTTAADLPTGQKATVNVTGYLPGVTAGYGWWGTGTDGSRMGVVSGTFSTNSSGAGSFSFTLPANAQVGAYGELGVSSGNNSYPYFSLTNNAGGGLRVTNVPPSTAPSGAALSVPSTAAVGSKITVSGTGCGGSNDQMNTRYSSVTVNVAGKLAGAAGVKADGSWSTQVTLPSGSGAVQVGATCNPFDNKSFAYAAKAVNGLTSTPTPTPSPSSTPSQSLSSGSCSPSSPSSGSGLVSISQLDVCPLAGASVSSTPFTDIGSDGLRSDIGFLYNTHITTGMTLTQYDPTGVVTRAQMAVFLYRLAGYPAFTPNATQKSQFTDIGSEGADFQKAIEWMVAAGITTGMTPTTFAPEAPVQRDQAAAFLYRFGQRMGKVSGSSYSVSGFSDVGFESDGFKNYIGWMSAEKITTGMTPSTFAPTQGVQRDQIAAFLHRFYNDYVA